MWNDEFELVNGSYSVEDVQVYIIKKHEIIFLIPVYKKN